MIYIELLPSEAKIKTLTGLMYALSSVLMTLMTFTMISMYKFPSHQLLSFLQTGATILVLLLAKYAGYVRIRTLDKLVMYHIWPLTVMSFARMAFEPALETDFALYMVLKPFSIFMSMVCEMMLLGFENSISMHCVAVISIGAIIASAANEDSFFGTDYAIVLLHNFHTSAAAVYLKKVLCTRALNVCELMYFDSLLIFLPSFIAVWGSGDLIKISFYEYWSDPLFLGHLVMQSLLGVIYYLCVILCTRCTNAVTTSAIESFISVSRYLIISYYYISWMTLIGLIAVIVGIVVFFR